MNFTAQQTLNKLTEARQKTIRQRILTQLTIRKGANLCGESERFARGDHADRKKDTYSAVVRIIGSPQLKSERDKYRRIGGGDHSAGCRSDTLVECGLSGWKAAPARGIRAAGARATWRQ